MIYRVVAYGRDDERIRGSFTIPQNSLIWAMRVAGILREDDRLGEYVLSDSQVYMLSTRLGFRPELKHLYYYLEPYEPPQDTDVPSDVA